ncbi:MAG: RloB family protein [Sedimentibacter sp.]
MRANERRGARKDRNTKRSTRTPELGYYLIVTDTKETEKNYLEGLRDSIPGKLKDKLVIKVFETKTVDIVEKCKELRNKDPQYRIPWIIFDKDQVSNFDYIISNAEKNDIYAGWSNPCIEIWFMAYFGSMPTINDSVICCNSFKDKLSHVSEIKYKKSDKDIYRHLNKYGNETIAIEVAEKRHIEYVNNCEITPSKMYSSSTVYILIKEINGKINNLHM